MACFLIPADTSSPYYQYSRAGTKLIGDAALLTTGAGAVYRGYKTARAGVVIGSEVYAATKSGRKILTLAKTETKITPNLAKINDFHRAAMQLSKQEKSTIRILRGWARSKGFKKLTPPRAMPEEWGIFINNEFRWNLKIKPQPGRWGGLNEGSKIPRFSTRISEGKYINPYTGEQVPKKIGSHFPLDSPYE